MSSLITAGNGRSVSSGFSNRHLKINIEHINIDEISGFLAANLKDKGIAGIICNTVMNASYVYDMLALRFPESKLFLTHSRFVAPDRMDKDAQVLGLAGKNSDRNVCKIIVGTQVLEQSLDIDFDILVSQHASLESVIQRMGRLHRHNRNSRPTLLSSPRFVFLTGDEDVPEGKYNQSFYTEKYNDLIYGSWPMELASDYFLGITSVLLPDDITKVIEHKHSAPNDAKSKSLLSEHNSEQQNKRNVTKPWIIPQPTARNDKPIYGFVEAMESEDRGEAKVRGSDSGPEVIAIFSDPNGTLWVPYYKDGIRQKYQINPSLKFYDSTVTKLLGSTIRLPSQYSHEKYISFLEKNIDQKLGEQFKNDHQLKYEKAIIFSGNEYKMLEKVFSYSPTTGLEDHDK